MPQDLVTPGVTNDLPAPGKRVKQVNADYTGTGVHHVLYLPTDWVKGKKYPVIVEYAGNRCEVCLGTVEGCVLGYGITRGQGVIWVCLPYVDTANHTNAPTWWGSVDATVAYCKKTVAQICAEYGGDPSAVFLAGFSRGSIACNFIGLHDDEIASLWRGFICHSQYDGVRQWPYAGCDRPAATARLRRLGNRPQFISQESSVEDIRQFLKEAAPNGKFTFLPMTFPHHTDRWILRDMPERKVVRQWFADVLTNRETNARVASRSSVLQNA